MSASIWTPIADGDLYVSKEEAAADDGSSLIGFKQAASTAVATTVEQELRVQIRLSQFGAVGDGVTDDTAAFNKAIAYARTFSGNVLPTIVFDGANENGPTNRYLCLGTLNFTQLRLLSMIIEFRGIVITSKAVGFPAIDALDSNKLVFKDLVLYGDPASPPTYGIQMGRGITGRNAEDCALYNCTIIGVYTKAAFLNAGCEIFLAEKCKFWNSSTAAGAATLVQDSKNASHVVSQFFTVTIAQDVQQSHNDNEYLNCTFEQISGSGASGGPAISITGSTNALRFTNCYAQNEYRRIVDIYPGTHSMLKIDMHGEALNLVNFILFKSSLGNIICMNCEFKEYYLFTTDSYITTDGGTGVVDMLNCDLSVADSYTTAPLFKKTGGSALNYHGKLELGINSNMYNLSQLTTVSGTIYCQDPVSSLVYPTLRNVVVHSRNSFITKYEGDHQFTGRFYWLSGTAIASAATLVIPNPGVEFAVTGTTNITAITCPAAEVGRIVTLVFSGILTVTNSYASGTLLAGNLVTAVGTRIMLRNNGIVWEEICRSANVVA